MSECAGRCLTSLDERSPNVECFTTLAKEDCRGAGKQDHMMSTFEAIWCRYLGVCRYEDAVRKQALLLWTDEHSGESSELAS